MCTFLPEEPGCVCSLDQGPLSRHAELRRGGLGVRTRDTETGLPSPREQELPALCPTSNTDIQSDVDPGREKCH